MANRRRSHPRTPDSRYLVVRGRLGLLGNLFLAPDMREGLVRELMAARSGVRVGRADHKAVAAARMPVEAAKRALGERGPAWWTEGARLRPPDGGGHLIGGMACRTRLNDAPRTDLSDEVRAECRRGFSAARHSEPYGALLRGHLSCRVAGSRLRGMCNLRLRTGEPRSVTGRTHRSVDGTSTARRSPA